MAGLMPALRGFLAYQQLQYNRLLLVQGVTHRISIASDASVFARKRLI